MDQLLKKTDFHLFFRSHFPSLVESFFYPPPEGGLELIKSVKDGTVTNDTLKKIAFYIPEYLVFIFVHFSSLRKRIMDLPFITACRQTYINNAKEGYNEKFTPFNQEEFDWYIDNCVWYPFTKKIIFSNIKDFNEILFKLSPYMGQYVIEKYHHLLTNENIYKFCMAREVPVHLPIIKLREILIAYPDFINIVKYTCGLNVSIMLNFPIELPLPLKRIKDGLVEGKEDIEWYFKISKLREKIVKDEEFSKTVFIDYPELYVNYAREYDHCEHIPIPKDILPSYFKIQMCKFNPPTAVRNFIIDGCDCLNGMTEMEKLKAFPLYFNFLSRENRSKPEFQEIIREYPKEFFDIPKVYTPEEIKSAFKRYSRPDECIICTKKNPTKVLMPCGHTHLCKDCDIPGDKCSMCNAVIDAVYTI